MGRLGCAHSSRLLSVTLLVVLLAAVAVRPLYAQSDSPPPDDSVPQVAAPDQPSPDQVPAADVVPTDASPAFPAPQTKSDGCVSGGGLPDAACTPGAVDPRVTQDNLNTTICRRGYTATVRPTVNVTEKIKRDQMAAYGLQGQRLADYELDHLISLELGGAPADVANLWPEPWNGDANAHMKDSVENYLNREVCRGAIQLVDAQRMIATDWLAIYTSRGLHTAP